MSLSDACWLSEVCECGAITEGEASECWRCGRPRHGHEAMTPDEPMTVEDDDAADATSRH